MTPVRAMLAEAPAETPLQAALRNAIFQKTLWTQHAAQLTRDEKKERQDNVRRAGVFSAKEAEKTAKRNEKAAAKEAKAKAKVDQAKAKVDQAAARAKGKEKKVQKEVNETASIDSQNAGPSTKDSHRSDRDKSPAKKARKYTPVDDPLFNNDISGADTEGESDDDLSPSVAPCQVFHDVRLPPPGSRELGDGVPAPGSPLGDWMGAGELSPDVLPVVG